MISKRLLFIYCIIVSIKALAYTPKLDPQTNCSSWEISCDITFGLKMAKDAGINGIIVNGYAYHTSASLHWPIGYVEEKNLNELTPGIGYTRSFLNPQYNSEYTLFIMGFMDSYYKPQLQAGYIYQYYFNLNNAGDLKWGIGYTPFIFIKPAITNDAPIPLPGIGIATSIKYQTVNIILTYANALLLNARLDF